MIQRVEVLTNDYREITFKETNGDYALVKIVQIEGTAAARLTLYSFYGLKITEARTYQQALTMALAEAEAMQKEGQ